MTVRTTSRTVILHVSVQSERNGRGAACRNLHGGDRWEELLQASSIPAYRRIATLLRLEQTTGSVF